jgi:hypothetical protein
MIRLQEPRAGIAFDITYKLECIADKCARAQCVGSEIGSVGS